MMRFKGKVGPVNLNGDYATPVSVLAETREEAVSKMLALGARGPRDSKVWIFSMDEEAIATSPGSCLSEEVTDGSPSTD